MYKVRLKSNEDAFKPYNRTITLRSIPNIDDFIFVDKDVMGWRILYRYFMPVESFDDICCELYLTQRVGK